MYKLIFADDERIVREGIQKIIDWEQCGFTVTGFCENGMEVLELVEAECPMSSLLISRCRCSTGLSCPPGASKI